jgi:hypothetical protein
VFSDGFLQHPWYFPKSINSSLYSDIPGPDTARALQPLSVPILASAKRETPRSMNLERKLPDCVLFRVVSGFNCSDFTQIRVESGSKNAFQMDDPRFSMNLKECKTGFLFTGPAS